MSNLEAVISDPDQLAEIVEQYGSPVPWPARPVTVEDVQDHIYLVQSLQAVGINGEQLISALGVVLNACRNCLDAEKPCWCAHDD